MSVTTMKHRFPFRLGTTSFILRDDILPNVRFLKDWVDHVELLVFETDHKSSYPTPDVVAELNAIASDYDLTYTVHLPIGIKLGSPDHKSRREDVEAVLRAVDATRELSPLAWDLHLELNEDEPYDEPVWQDTCLQSLNELKAGGLDPARTGVETLEFDFQSTLPLLDESGFAITLDIGHVWHRGFDESHYIEKYLPRAVSIHMHGFNHERDHKGLHHIPTSKIEKFLSAVSTHPNVTQLPISVEVFNETCFQNSMEALNEIA